MAENIDIYDANLSPIGVKERAQAHRDGDWHRTFHLWLTSSRHGGSLLLQLRSPTAKNFPNLLDITAAGHLLSGETPEMGIREATEELGISISPDEMTFLGYRVEVADQQNGQRNREYQAVYLAEEALPLENFNPDPNEVYGVLELKISDGFALFTGSVDVAVTQALIFDPATKKWSLKPEEISRERFLPRIQNYYLTMLIMAERHLTKSGPIAIS